MTRAAAGVITPTAYPQALIYFGDTPLVRLDPPGPQRVAAALAAVGQWGASLHADALLVVWHDAQLYGALESDCRWPGRLCALRASPGDLGADYYPAVIEGAGPLRAASWQTAGSIRDPQPTLPVVMLGLLAGWRTGRSAWRRPAWRRLITLGVEVADKPWSTRSKEAARSAAGR